MNYINKYELIKAISTKEVEYLDHQTSEILGKEIMAFELHELKKTFTRHKDI